MRRTEGTRRLAAVGALLTVWLPAAAKADAVLPISEGAVAGIGVAVALLPSEVGVAIPTAGASRSTFVLGWSLQFPVIVTGEHAFHHRIVTAVDLLPHSDGADWRGRLGYRYCRRHAFAGLGVGVDGAGGNVSPELGLKFAHAERDPDEFDASLHLVARAGIAPETGHVRGATVLLGWNLF